MGDQLLSSAPVIRHLGYYFYQEGRNTVTFAICIMHIHAGGDVSLLFHAMKTQVTGTQILTSKYLNTVSW